MMAVGAFLVSALLPLLCSGGGPILNAVLIQLKAMLHLVTAPLKNLPVVPLSLSVKAALLIVT